MHRDERIDFLRGLALLVMAVNHLDVKASLFYVFTGQGRFYISAAEGFYFLSGLVLGLVAARQPLERMLRRLLRRLGQLYALTLAVSIAFTLLGLAGLRLWYDLQHEIPPVPELAGYFGRMLSLQNAFHGGEILALYVILLLGAIPALWACAHGKSWLVGLVSLSAYTAGQAFPGRAYLGLDTIFAALNWQIIFFGGLLAGYHRQALGRAWRRINRRGWVQAAVLLTVGAFLWLHTSGYRLWPGLPTLLGERESQMAPLRLALVGLYLLVFFLLTVRLWGTLRPALGWLLLPMGRHSLAGFVTHLFGIVLIYNLPFFTRQPDLLLGTGLHLVMLALVWGVVSLLEPWAVARQVPLSAG